MSDAVDKKIVRTVNNQVDHHCMICSSATAKKDLLITRDNDETLIMFTICDDCLIRMKNEFQHIVGKKRGRKKIIR